MWCLHHSPFGLLTPVFKRIAGPVRICRDPVHHLQASNAATAVNDDDYVVGEDDREDMLDEDNDILDDLPPTRDNGAAVRQQTAVAAAAQRPVSNADAGADVAMQILRLCEGLGGSATAHDYEQILQVWLQCFFPSCPCVQSYAGLLKTLPC